MCVYASKLHKSLIRLYLSDFLLLLSCSHDRFLFYVMVWCEPAGVTRKVMYTWRVAQGVFSNCVEFNNVEFNNRNLQVLFKGPVLDSCCSIAHHNHGFIYAAHFL